MGKPRARAAPNMLLLDPARCALDTDADIGLVGTAAMASADVARLQRRDTADTELDAVLPRVGLLNGPIGHGTLHPRNEHDAHSAQPAHASGNSGDGDGGGRVDGSALDSGDARQDAIATSASTPTSNSNDLATFAHVQDDAAAGQSDSGSVVVREGGSAVAVAVAAAAGSAASFGADDGATVTARVVLYSNPPPPSSVTLIVALCRVKVFGRVLETATAMGVKTFHVVDTARVERA
jgi:hypothetical protein